MIRIDLNSPAAFEVWRTDTVGALYELAKRAPGQTARLAIGSEEVLVLQDAEAARHVLHGNGANYAKNFGGFEGFFGDSRLTSDGARWEMLQALSQPHISAARPARVAEVSTRAFQQAADALLAQRDAAGGLVIDAHLNRAAAQVVSEAALDFQALEISDALLADFHDVLSYGSLRSWNMAGGIQAEDTALRARFVTARERLGRTITAAAARATAGGTTPSLLRALTDAEDDGVDLVGEICTLLFAGFDTSAAAISWGALLLAAMPDLQRFLRGKVRDACGDRAPTLEQVNAIPELSAFQNEVLRIFPPVPLLSRIANAADSVGTLAIGRQQRVLVSLIGLHHDRRVFPEPASLRLSRYPDGRPTREQARHLLPFGVGRRSCGGSGIATVEMAVAFAVLLQRLEFGIPDHRPLRFEWNASLRRRGGQYLLVREAPGGGPGTG